MKNWFNKRLIFAIILIIIIVLPITFIVLKLMIPIGKSADFSVLYATHTDAPQWDNMPAEGVAWEFFEFDGVSYVLIDSGTVDATGLVSIDVKRNVEYRFSIAWNSGSYDYDILNPSGTTSVSLTRKAIIGDEFWLNTLPPELLTDEPIELFYWNTDLSDWESVYIKNTDSLGAGYFYGLIMGLYTFDMLTTYDLTQDLASIHETDIYIEPLSFMISMIAIFWIIAIIKIKRKGCENYERNVRIVITEKRR